MKSSELCFRFLFVLLASSITLAERINGVLEQGHLVQNSKDFHDTITNRSMEWVFLNQSVEIRNYYGWTFNTQRQRPTGSISLEAYPYRVSNERPKVDLDGYFLNDLLTGRQSLYCQRLHFLNVDLPSREESESIQNNTVILENCVVEVFIRQKRAELIETYVQSMYSLLEDPSSHSVDNTSIVTHWWCLRNEGIPCPSGAAYYYNDTLQWTENYSWKLIDTLIVFLPRIEKTVAINPTFVEALDNLVDHIAVPYNLMLTFSTCDKSNLLFDTTIYDPNRSIPPSVNITFAERLYGCRSLVSSHFVRVTDLILLNILWVDAWPVLFPFVNSRELSYVFLENVVLKMVAQWGVPLELNELANSIRSRPRPDDLNDGMQSIEVWEPSDCETYIRHWTGCLDADICAPQLKCPLGAIFIEDAAFVIEKGDGHSDLAIGSIYRVRYTFIPVVMYEDGSVDISTPSAIGQNVEEAGNVNVKFNGQPNAYRVILVLSFIGVGVLCILFATCIITAYRRGRFSMASNSTERLPISMTKRFSTKGGTPAEKTFLTPQSNPKSETVAAIHLDRREDYQITANQLLGSVVLGPLLGSGSFGKVFKATWNGATVAVKVIVHDGFSRHCESAKREAVLSSNLHHPNIVQTFEQTTRQIGFDEPSSSVCSPNFKKESQKSIVPPQTQPGEGVDDGYVNLAVMVPNEYRPERPQRSSVSFSDVSSTGRSFCADRRETWLVQEYCDLNSLEKAIRKKKFMKGNQLNMLLILDTLMDISRGMLYLKTRNVIHGDLKSSNILLSTNANEMKGFIAKVADFGLSRELGMHASHVSTQTTGTVTHMPPELFREERLTAASDVYSFGIVMWELVSKESLMEGVPPFLIIKKVLYDHWRPTFQESVPEYYVDLARRCWAERPESRPLIDQVLSELELMKKQFQPISCDLTASF